MSLDACEPISFKLGMVIEITKLYILIPVWMTSTFTQGHMIMTNLNLCDHSVVKWHDLVQSFAIVDNVRDDCTKIL